MRVIRYDKHSVMRRADGQWFQLIPYRRLTAREAANIVWRINEQKD